jgi:hypothetical protein
MTIVTFFSLKMQRQWRKLHAVDIYVQQPDQIPLVQNLSTRDEKLQVLQSITVVK